MRYAEEYIRYLDEQEIRYERNVTEDGDVVIEVPYAMDSDDSHATIVTFFSEDSDIVQTAFIADVRIKDASKRSACMELLNKANNDYKLVKFSMREDGKVMCNIDTYVLGDFDAESFFDMLRMGVRIYDIVYPDVRKVQWT